MCVCVRCECVRDVGLALTMTSFYDEQTSRTGKHTNLETLFMSLPLKVQRELTSCDIRKKKRCFATSLQQVPYTICPFTNMV